MINYNFPTVYERRDGIMLHQCRATPCIVPRAPTGIIPQPRSKRCCNRPFLAPTCPSEVPRGPRPTCVNNDNFRIIFMFIDLEILASLNNIHKMDCLIQCNRSSRWMQPRQSALDVTIYSTCTVVYTSRTYDGRVATLSYSTCGANLSPTRGTLQYSEQNVT